MPIVTLTTDFGLEDYYVAMIKGAMLCQNSALNFVDISHSVKPYDIVQGAFVLGNAWRHFPEGAIHLASINNLSNKRLRFLAIRHNGHYFVGPDNGLFYLIFNQMPREAFIIERPKNSPFPIKDIFANAVRHITEGREFSEIGQHTPKILERINLHPVTGPFQIRGTVSYVDHYDNVVVNITRDEFERIGGKRKFSVTFKRHDPITSMSTAYWDVPVGDTLCLFNSAGYLEIAVNMGRASELLGLNIGDMVQVDFS